MWYFHKKKIIIALVIVAAIAIFACIIFLGRDKKPNNQTPSSSSQMTFNPSSQFDTSGNDDVDATTDGSWTDDQTDTSSDPIADPNEFTLSTVDLLNWELYTATEFIGMSDTAKMELMSAAMTYDQTLNQFEYRGYTIRVIAELGSRDTTYSFFCFVTVNGIELPYVLSVDNGNVRNLAPIDFNKYVDVRQFDEKSDVAGNWTVCNDYQPGLPTIITADGDLELNALFAIAFGDGEALTGGTSSVVNHNDLLYIGSVVDQKTGTYEYAALTVIQSKEGGDAHLAFVMIHDLGNGGFYKNALCEFSLNDY